MMIKEKSIVYEIWSIKEELGYKNCDVDYLKY